MTHIPEIGAENRYQKPLPKKFGTKLHVRRSINGYRFSGTGFWRRFLLCVSLALGCCGNSSCFWELTFDCSHL